MRYHGWHLPGVRPGSTYLLIHVKCECQRLSRRHPLPYSIFSTATSDPHGIAAERHCLERCTCSPPMQLDWTARQHTVIICACFH